MIDPGAAFVTTDAKSFFLQWRKLTTIERRDSDGSSWMSTVCFSNPAPSFVGGSSGLQGLEPISNTEAENAR